MAAIIGLLSIIVLLLGLILFITGLVGLCVYFRSKKLKKEKPHRSLKTVILSIVIGILISIPGAILGTAIIQSKIYDARYSKTIEYAADTNNFALVKQLLEHGANPDECFLDGTYTPLMHACSRTGGYNVAKLLLEHKANPNLTFAGYKDGSQKGYTSLMFAAPDTENYQLVRLLVDNGADVNHIAADGETPLSQAEHFHNADVITYLQSVGAE